MQSKLIFLSAMLVSLQCFSQIKVGEQKIDMFLIPSGASVSDGKTVSIQSFYISNEISNKQYRAFTDYAIQHPDSSLSYYDIAGRTHYFKYTVIIRDLIDSSVMEKAAGIRFKNYFTNLAFDNYPVVGVSFNNAEWYCAWLNREEKKSGNNSSELFRLPFKDEWIYASKYTAFENANPSIYQTVTVGDKNEFGLNHFQDNPQEYCRSIFGNVYILGGEKQIEQAKTIDAGYQKSAFVGFRIAMTSLNK